MKRILSQPSAKIAACIGGLGGFLLGYNTAIISGVLLVITDILGLNTAKKANVVSILILAALLGAVLAGFIADKLGRKKTLILAMGLYCLGALIQSVSYTYGVFVLGRFVTGIAAGLGAFVIPLYLSEIAPPKSRGMFVSINQLSVAFGVLFAYLMNFLFDETLNWRAVFLFSAFFALVQVGLAFFLPESPSWLLAMTKRKEARAILRQTRPDEDADKIIAQVEKHLMNASKDYYLKKIIVPSIIAGLILSFMQQISGFNAIIYYAPTILQQAGFFMIKSANEGALLLGLMLLIGTGFSLYFVDKLGRKPLLLFGLGFMSFLLLVLSVSFYFTFSMSSGLILVSLALFVGAYAVSLGPVVWLLISEIFPLAVRGKVIALCVFVNFLTNYLVSLFFLPMFQNFTPAVTFLIFALFTSLSVYYVSKFVPETSNKTLEDIEKFWKKS